MSLTDKLDTLMKEKKINKAELARAAEIPYTTVDGWYKKGADNVKLSTLKRLCRYFNCTLDYLTENSPSSEPHTIAAHFDGDEYTKEELEEICKYAEFVKSRRK